jgi:hypothetical protein
MAFLVESGNPNNSDVEPIFHRYVQTKEFGLEKALRSITFVPKDSCVAIQLADFIAYYTRRHTEACIKAGGPLSELPPYPRRTCHMMALLLPIFTARRSLPLLGHSF